MKIIYLCIGYKFTIGDPYFKDAAFSASYFSAVLTLNNDSAFQGLVLFSPTNVPPFLWHKARIRVANRSPVLPRWFVFSMTTGKPTA
jgi:hypothetical protein